MTLLALLAYTADVVILGAYALMVRGRSARPFHWANALGCLPLFGVEVATHAWPVAPVTVTFGILGWIGVVKKCD